MNFQNRNNMRSLNVPYLFSGNKNIRNISKLPIEFYFPAYESKISLRVGEQENKKENAFLISLKYHHPAKAQIRNNYN